MVGLCVAAAFTTPLSLFATQLLLQGVSLLGIGQWWRLWREDRPLMLSVAAVAVSWLVSWTFSPAGAVAWIGIKDAWILALFLSVTATRRSIWIAREWVFAGFGAGMMVLASYVLIQHATHHDWVRNRPLLVLNGVEVITGFYRNSLTLAGFGTLVGFVLALQAAQPRPLGFLPRLRWSLWALMGWVIVFITKGRTYWVCAPVLLWLVGLRGGLRSWLLTTITLVVLVSVGAAWGWTRAPVRLDYVPPLHATITLRLDSSAAERLLLLDVGIAAWLDHPLTGTGRGYAAFTPTIKPYVDRIAQNRHWPNYGQNYGHLHNNYLQLAAETGLIGVLAMTALIIVILHRCCTRPLTRDARLLLLGCAVFMGLGGCFEYNLGDVELLMPWTLLVGMCYPQHCSPQNHDHA